MPTLTDKQALDLLTRLFPVGLKDPALLVGICPEGWENSLLRLAYHPTPEQRYKEHLQWLQSPIFSFCNRNDPTQSEPPPTFDEFIAGEENTDQYTATNEEEWQELLGACLWDILSDNHELITDTGQSIDFGSFRAVSALIDEFLEGDSHRDGWSRGDCMRFYMGTSQICQRTDLKPVYQLIFRRLKSIGYEWRYSFPQIYAVRFPNPQSSESDYDPSSALAEEIEHKEQQEKLAKNLTEAKQRALDAAPPTTIQAYQDVYAKAPHGWPPEPSP